MRRLLLLLAAVGMIFTACESNDGVDEGNGDTPFVPEITISPKELTFDYNGGEQTVVITANFDYEVDERCQWVDIEQTDEGLLVAVDANKNSAERSASISITNSQYDINKSIEVYQGCYVPKIELSETFVEVGFESVQCAINITSPYSWDAISKNDWIVVNKNTGIPGTKEMKFTVELNPEMEIREGTIVIKNEDYNLVTELYVTQAPFVPKYRASNEFELFPADGGLQGVSFYTNFEYEVFTNDSWITVKKLPKSDVLESNGKAASEYLFHDAYEITTAPSGVLEERSGSIYLYSEKYDVLKSFTIKQAGVSPTATSNRIIRYTSSDGQIIKPQPGAYFGDGVNMTSNNYIDGQGLIIFDKDVTFIERHAFLDCVSLVSIEIPARVEVIGMQAFRGCTSLTAFYGKFASEDNRALICKHNNGELYLQAYATACTETTYDIPDKVTNIGGYVFEGCSLLKSVTIPSTVETIGSGAFANCASLVTIRCYSSTPPKLDTGGLFAEDESGWPINGANNNLKIYVPGNYISDYCYNSDWAYYVGIIQGY